MELQILKYVAEHWGLFGLLAAFLLGTPAYMAFTYHKTRVTELKTQVTENKQDKEDYKNVITGNTQAITEMAGLLRENTQATRDLRNSIERGRQ